MSLSVLYRHVELLGPLVSTVSSTHQLINDLPEKQATPRIKLEVV